MIVSCPGCATHYHHSGPEPGRSGRCTRCDERVLLERPSRRYLLLPTAAEADSDPLLATGLRETEAHVDRPAVVTEPAPTEFETPVDALPPVEEIPVEEDDSFFGDAMNDDEALFGMEDEPALAAPEPAPAEELERPRHAPAHPVREALGVFLLAGLGAAAGYQGSLEFGFNPLNAIGVGLGVGITFGWAWIRWAERKR